MSQAVTGLLETNIEHWPKEEVAGDSKEQMLSVSNQGKTHGGQLPTIGQAFCNIRCCIYSTLTAGCYS